MKYTKNEQRKKRKIRIRKRLTGTAQQPRLCVFRSNTNIYAQVIDDEQGVTLVASSLKALGKDSQLNKETAFKVGQDVADKAKAKKIDKVVFDRNGYIYHGKVKALADGARKGGLKF